MTSAISRIKLLRPAARALFRISQSMNTFLKATLMMWVALYILL